MKLFQFAKPRSGHSKNEGMPAHTKVRPAIHDPSHCPRHLLCMVKGPGDKRVALVPIWMPLSIMSSYAVKAAGGSDEVASIASLAVISQGNAIIKNIKEGVILNEEDVFRCIDAVARNTRETLLRTVGDCKIAYEVEAMIRGGGQLILNSNRGDVYDESRDDQNSSTLCEDVQSIATTILNNFDSDMMSTSYGMMSEYATNDIVANKGRKVLNYTTVSQSVSSSTTTYEPALGEAERIPPIFGWSALLPAWTWDGRKADLSTQLSESSTGPVSLSYVLKNHPELETQKYLSPSFDPTWDTSKNASFYETTDEISLYEPTSTYRTHSCEFPESPNLSMEPALDTNAPIAHNVDNQGKAPDIPNSISASNVGRGIFAIASKYNTNIISNGINVTDNINDQNTEVGQSITTKSIQMKEKGCCSFNIQNSSPGTLAHIKHHMEDQRSTSSKITEAYQSYVEPGKEVDDITFLNAQMNQKKSLLKRTKLFFRKWFGIKKC